MRFSFVSFDNHKFEEMGWWFEGVASKYRQFFTSSFIWLVIFQAIASTAYMTKTLIPCNFWLKIELKNLIWTNFLMLLKWWSSIRWFSQICLNTWYESRKIAQSFYILGYLRKLIIKIWRFEVSFSLKSGKSGPFFSHEKYFEEVEIKIFRLKFRPQK
jgi:hypothetical protein